MLSVDVPEQTIPDTLVAASWGQSLDLKRAACTVVEMPNVKQKK
uniref:Uncharacterized protein n=1 Tax=Anguilla anguilla TaxID=7936 RepID=A0A0E9WIV2_ANGAN